MAQMTGGQAIVRTLMDHDVDVIFGLPGVRLDTLFDGLDVVTIAVNDRAFGNVKRIQKDSYGARHIAVDLHNPDFVALADSFGMAGWRAETPEALQRALTEALAARAPGLIEIPVGELPSIWPLIQRPPSQGTA